MSKVSFGSAKIQKYAGYELNFSEKELDKMLDEQTVTYTMATTELDSYKALKDGDKKALKYLVKAAKILNDVYLKQDNEHNIELKKSLEEASEKGDTQAYKALELFNGMNGVMGRNNAATMICLVKDLEPQPGKNFYPSDITENELKNDIKEKLSQGRKAEVNDLLSVRTVVKRDDSDKLYSVDYVDEYSEEFSKAADELEKAAKVSTNEDFNKYLVAQAKAFRKADPEPDCEADRLWAKMQDTPLEFTISREQYQDRLSVKLQDDLEMNALFKKNAIDAQSKDSIGVRVGIVNKNGTDAMLDYKNFLPELAKQMPLSDQYEQCLTEQNMVDADIVYLSGDEGKDRGGIAVAQNLPNDEKLSVQRGYGRETFFTDKYAPVRKKKS